jgi:hypothetical protein
VRSLRFQDLLLAVNLLENTVSLVSHNRGPADSKTAASLAKDRSTQLMHMLRQQVQTVQDAGVGHRHQTRDHSSSQQPMLCGIP